MTEYDFSPEAFEAHIRKQHQIARWVDNTNHTPLRNPFTPATPAVQAIALSKGYDYDDYDDSSRHYRKKESRDSRDRYRDDRDRDRDRNRGDRIRSDKETSSRHHHSSSISTSKTTKTSTTSTSTTLTGTTAATARPANTKRHRSASQSHTTTRPEPSRSHTLPLHLQLQIAPHHNTHHKSYLSSQQSLVSPPNNTYPTKLVSRDSKHSSRTSSTTKLPSPTSYLPPQPYSAPAVGNAPQLQHHRPHHHQQPPVRSQTSPTYGYSADAKHGGYPFPQGHGGPAAYPMKGVDPATAPQYPHSMYQPKPTPLLKRLFQGLTGGNKNQDSPPRQRVPRRKRSSSF